MSAEINSSTILRTRADVVCLNYPGVPRPVFVLQLNVNDQNVLVKEGGELVFSLLELCDGKLNLGAVTEELQRRFDGRDQLWATELKEAIEVLRGWRVLEIVQA